MSSLLRRYKLSKLIDVVLSEQDEELFSLLNNRFSNLICESTDTHQYYYKNDKMVFEYCVIPKKLYIFYVDSDRDDYFNKMCILVKQPKQIISEWIGEIYNIEIKNCDFWLRNEK